MKITRNSLKKQIDALSDSQLENLNEYINYHFHTTTDDVEIKAAKDALYLYYKKDIAPLINSIEVYSHRFDIKLFSGVETIFRHMASLEKDFDEKFTKEKALKCYADLMDYAINLRGFLSIYLIKIYIKIIKQYRKKLTKFNYKGVYPDFKKVLDEGIKYLGRVLKLESKIFKVKFDVLVGNDIEFRIDGDVREEQRKLGEAFVKAENLIDLCESQHSKIVASGYLNVFLDKVFPFLSIILSIFFSIVGVIGLINLIK